MKKIKTYPECPREFSIPFAFLQFMDLSEISENSIRLYDWPEGIFAGRLMSGGMGKVKLEDLPEVFPN